jgi:hypothetical protein
MWKIKANPKKYNANAIRQMRKHGRCGVLLQNVGVQRHSVHSEFPTFKNLWKDVRF